jgi:hypothetical protein
MSSRGRHYVLPHYNGFDDKARRAVTPIQNEAIRCGALIRPTTCSICGFTDPANPQGRGYIFLHTENYAEPLTIYPLCKRHHADLHARFRDPERWQRVLERYGRPQSWFVLLSTDPAAQFTSYHDLYPTGLPEPDYITEVDIKSLLL